MKRYILMMVCFLIVVIHIDGQSSSGEVNKAIDQFSQTSYLNQQGKLQLQQKLLQGQKQYQALMKDKNGQDKNPQPIYQQNLYKQKQNRQVQHKKHQQPKISSSGNKKANKKNGHFEMHQMIAQFETIERPALIKSIGIDYMNKNQFKDNIRDQKTPEIDNKKDPQPEKQTSQNKKSHKEMHQKISQFQTTTATSLTRYSAIDYMNTNNFKREAHPQPLTTTSTDTINNNLVKQDDKNKNTAVKQGNNDKNQQTVINLDLKDKVNNDQKNRIQKDNNNKGNAVKQQSDKNRYDPLKQAQQIKHDKSIKQSQKATQNSKQISPQAQDNPSNKAKKLIKHQQGFNLSPPNHLPIKLSSQQLQLLQQKQEISFFKILKKINNSIITDNILYISQGLLILLFLIICIIKYNQTKKDQEFIQLKNQYQLGTQKSLNDL